MSRSGPERADGWYEKAAEAAKLKRAGHTWAEVAIATGYASRQSAHDAVRRLMQDHQSLAYHEIALYRQESLDRLSELLKAVWPAAMRADDKMVTQARLIISQIGDLTGEKAPTKVEIGGSDVDRLLRDAVDEFERRAAELDRQAAGVQADQGSDS